MKQRSIYVRIRASCRAQFILKAQGFLRAKRSSLWDCEIAWLSASYGSVDGFFVARAKAPEASPVPKFCNTGRSTKRVAVGLPVAEGLDCHGFSCMLDEKLQHRTASCRTFFCESGSLQMPAKTVPFPRSGPTRSTAHTTHIGQNAQESGAVVCLAPEPSGLED